MTDRAVVTPSRLPGQSECPREVSLASTGRVISSAAATKVVVLLGTWNWWLPAWLDRLLPTIDAENSDELWAELDAAGQLTASDSTAL